MKCAKFQKILSTFNFETNLGRRGGKYFFKIVFDVKIEIDILEILHVTGFDKF